MPSYAAWAACLDMPRGPVVPFHLYCRRKGMGESSDAPSGLCTPPRGRSRSPISQSPIKWRHKGYLMVAKKYFPPGYAEKLLAESTDVHPYKNSPHQTAEFGALGRSLLQDLRNKFQVSRVSQSAFNIYESGYGKVWHRDRNAEHPEAGNISICASFGAPRRLSKPVQLSALIICRPSTVAGNSPHRP